MAGSPNRASSFILICHACESPPFAIGGRIPKLVTAKTRRAPIALELSAGRIHPTITGCIHPFRPETFSEDLGKQGSMAPKIPQPGPAILKKDSDIDAWLEKAKRNKYLPEAIMKQIFERCKQLLMEESNTQPVSTPVTICGDIQGQF